MHTDSVGNTFLHSMDQRISATIDDFRFGILGGAKMTKDPLVNVIGSISNSPGAVLQAGIGNRQQIDNPGGIEAARIALAEFLRSREVQALDPAEKQTIEDVTEVISTELAKATPDKSKVGRWGKRLLEVAERLGVATAANAISHSIFG
jgi:hypothetical protein